MEAVTISTETQLPQISKFPRYTEGARYWLQWAGMPDSIYSRTNGKNDYSDDFQSRGYWVNYLAGGSSVLPTQGGLNIPLNLAFAFHTDAGTFQTDSIVGTLGICTVLNSLGESTFKNGISRWTSRDMTDIIQTQITDDIRRLYAPEGVRRGLWNKSYSEARVPEVPTMLLELLSHQNFSDMRYGLDPRFRFAVSRAIYKGKNKVQLSWKAVVDSLEPTAVAEKFVVYTRIDDGDFNNGQVVHDSKWSVDLQTGKIYSFKITAVNKGGESFPSEILSAYRANSSRSVVLVVNGFDRVSAPASFTKNHSTAGFNADVDAGVPYISEYGYIGK
ncbi:fibronectin type III domain-containing protein, partial [bacterium]|nr:fibronectin type III domain-containing protein [bacterium]